MSQALLDRQLNDCLTVELGWAEVAKGLTKILVGYGIWIMGSFFGLMLVLMPLIESGFKIESTRLRLGQLWMFYAGLGLLSIIGMLSFGIIMGGKWRCIISASERNGCRWLMFLCLASLAMSMALSVLSSVSGMKVQPEFSKGVIGLGRARFTSAGIIFNLGSVALSMAYTCTFALFLRSVAQCMDSRWHVRMVDLFLSFFVPLALASVYLIYKVLTTDQNVLKLLLLVAVGWVACFIYWLVMIVLVRSCILKTLARVREPMAYSAIVQAKAPRRELNFN
jgi:hypothetical protein